MASVQRRAAIYLAAIFAATFLWRATTNAIATTFPMIAKFYLGFSPSQVMYLAGLVSIGSFISSFFITQRLRGAASLRASIALLSLTTFLIAYSGREELPALLLVEGLVTGVTSPLLITAAGSVGSGRERERAIALYSLALSTSLVVGPAAESAVLQATGQDLRLSLAAFSALPALSFVSSLAFRPAATGDGRRASRASVLSRPGFWKGVMANAIYTFPFVAVVNYGGILAAQAFRASYSISVLLFSAFYGTSFLTRLFLTIRPAGGVEGYVASGVALTVLGLVIVWLHPALWAFIVGYMILGIPHGLFWPISLIIIRREFRDQDIGSANSYYISINNLIWLATPFAAGLIESAVGLSGTFLVVAVPSVAAYLIYRLV